MMKNPSSKIQTSLMQTNKVKAKYELKSQGLDFESEPSVCVRIGIVGCGYWGPNLIRNFHELSNSKVVAVSDLQAERLKPLGKKFPGIKLTTHYLDILRDSSIDAVVIATPVSTHYLIASRALKASTSRFMSPNAATI